MIPLRGSNSYLIEDKAKYHKLHTKVDINFIAITLKKMLVLFTLMNFPHFTSKKFETFCKTFFLVQKLSISRGDHFLSKNTKIFQHFFLIIHFFTVLVFVRNYNYFTLSFINCLQKHLYFSEKKTHKNEF